jgi:ABC-type multidrug transport system fused ATPase/permease subunit
VSRSTAAPKREGLRAFKLLNRFAQGNRKWLLFGLVMLVLEAFSAVYALKPLAYLIDFLRGGRNANKPPLLFEPFIDLFRTAPDQIPPLIPTVAVLTIGIIVLAMINSLADSLAEIYLARGGRLLGLSLRVTLHSHLQRLSLAFHNQRRTGDVLTRITSDVTQIEVFLTESFSDIAGSLLLVPIILISILQKSWELAVTALLIVPVVSLVSQAFSKRIKASSKRERAREGELASAAQEMLTSIRVIQTYGRGEREQERFAEQSRHTMVAALQTAKLEAGFSWTVKSLEALAIAAIIWAVVYLRTNNNAITIGELVLFLGLVDQMFKPTRRIIKEWSVIGKVLASVERVAELLARKPSVDDLPDAVPAAPFQGWVELRNVSFAYQSEPQDGAEPSDQAIRLTLDDVSFRVGPGEVVALVGPSGAGKSTVAQLVPRLYDPQTGAVLIDGHDIRHFTLNSLRSQIGMVLQDTILFTGSVAYNIAYGRPEASREEIVSAAKEANAHEFIEKMPAGYDTELSERAANLSGGQRQRIAIARALIRDAPILMLDEPTTGLDAESTDLVLQALQRLMKGKTTIIISHDLNLVRSSNRIVVIRQGRIEQVGHHEELLRRGGLYASLYERQFGAAEPVSEPPVPVDFDGDGEDEESRRVFETMLLEALPMPAPRGDVESIVQGLPRSGREG